MRTILFAIVFVLLPLIAGAQKPNLDKLLEKKRNEYLLKIAYETVMKHAPEWYRDHKEPLIRSIVFPDGEEKVAYYRFPTAGTRNSEKPFYSPYIKSKRSINLTKFPKAKRDSIAIQIAISAMKKYAPSYYHEDLVPAVYEDYFRSDQDKNYGKIQYVVGFPFDIQKAIREEREGENIYGGAVYIIGETGRAVAIHLTGWMTMFEIDEVATRGAQQKVAQPMTVPRSPFKK